MAGRVYIVRVQGYSLSRQQEPETAGHIVSTVRKQREMDAGAQLTVSFLFSLVLPTLWWVLPPELL